jgi:hypothetical protein
LRAGYTTLPPANCAEEKPVLAEDLVVLQMNRGKSEAVEVSQAGGKVLTSIDIADVCVKLETTIDWPRVFLDSASTKIFNITGTGSKTLFSSSVTSLNVSL